MSENKVICEQHNIDYMSIRIAMTNGVRTLSELAHHVEIDLKCETCIKNAEKILKSVCGCKNVSVKEIVDLVNQGHHNLLEIVQVSNVGSECGKCKMLVENIIELGK